MKSICLQTSHYIRLYTTSLSYTIQPQVFLVHGKRAFPLERLIKFFVIYPMAELDFFVPYLIVHFK